MSAFADWRSRLSFKSSRIGFLEDLAEILMSGGGGLQDKLIKLAVRNAGKPVERVYRHLHQVINNGGDISIALKPYFAPNEFSMIAAYDAGSANDMELGKGLLAVSKILGPIQDLKREGVRLIIKTAFSLSMVLVMWLGIAGSFAKDMEQLAPRKNWFALSSIVIGSGEWLVQHWFIGAVLFGSLIALALWSLPNWTGRGRAWADQHLPGFTVYREFRSSLTLIALASFMKSKQGLGLSFKKVSESANPWEMWYLDMMRDNTTRLAGSAMLDVNFFEDRIMSRLVMRDDVVPLEVSLEQVGLDQAHVVVDAMRRRLEAAGAAASSAGIGFAGTVVIAVLLIMASAMTSLQGLR